MKHCDGNNNLVIDIRSLLEMKKVNSKNIENNSELLMLHLNDSLICWSFYDRESRDLFLMQRRL